MENVRARSAEMVYQVISLNGDTETFFQQQKYSHLNTIVDTMCPGCSAVTDADRNVVNNTTFGFQLQKCRACHNIVWHFIFRDYTNVQQQPHHSHITASVLIFSISNFNTSFRRAKMSFVNVCSSNYFSHNWLNLSLSFVSSYAKVAHK